MNHPHKNEFRILGIALSARGVGFALMEGAALVDWGVKTVKDKKNERSHFHVANLLEQYRPTVLALENVTAKGVRRASRIQELHREMIALASNEGVEVKLFSRNHLMGKFFVNGEGTRHALAGLLAERYPQELASRLPKKRQAWTSEDHRMDIFVAVALTQCVRPQENGRIHFKDGL